jgi:excisionase family DNA binding protein
VSAQDVDERCSTHADVRKDNLRSSDMRDTTTRGDGPDLMKPAEVAVLFGVGTKTVARWARTGRVPTVRTLGGHFRFRREDIEALVSEAQHRR